MELLILLFRVALLFIRITLFIVGEAFVFVVALALAVIGINAMGRRGIGGRR